MAKRFPKPKDSDDILDYEFGWDRFLPAGDTIETSTFEVVSGTCTLGAYDDSHTDDTATVWVSGGTAGGTCEILNRIVTVGGRQKDQTGIIKIKEN